MDILKPHRAKIDQIDDQIIDLLALRAGVIRDVAAIKKQYNIPVILPDRVEEVIERCAARAQSLGLDPDLVRALYTKLVEHACDTEERIIKKS